MSTYKNLKKNISENFIIRPATLDDAEAAFELDKIYSVELIGKPKFNLDEIKSVFQSHTMNMEKDLCFIFNKTGKLVSYAGVRDEIPHVKLLSWGIVHPEYRGQGLGAYLAYWLEERAKQSIPLAPKGARVVLEQFVFGCDTTGQNFLISQGYKAERYFLRMQIKMDVPPPTPVFPQGITIQTFDVKAEEREKTLRAIVQASIDIFKDHWGEGVRPIEEELKHCQHDINHDPDFDPTLWFMAMDDKKIAGFCLCSFKMPEDPEMAYVEDLGVVQQWRRKGVALGLLHHAFGELYSRGRYKAATDVDAASLTGATYLYEKVGMHKQRHEIAFWKEMRSGKDLTTQSITIKS